ncbi:MAG: hypothetical protein O3C21_14815 [Verrucomicrobia bacterium]|nr:hypothetical protein [Verrucomicrobiota bacterium]
MEAESIRLLLASHDIDADIPDAISAGLVPPFFVTKSGVRVQVEDSLAEEARAIIRDYRNSPAPSMED